MKIYTHLVYAALLMTAVNSTHAATVEGYWKAIDDQTGQPLSIIKIDRTAANTYDGTIVYRYPNNMGYVLKTCDKCKGINQGKSIVGMKVLTGLRQSADQPNRYINGHLLDVRTGRVYNGRAVLSSDGNRLNMRGYLGIELLGKGIVYLRTDSPSPEL